MAMGTTQEPITIRIGGSKILGRMVKTGGSRVSSGSYLRRPRLSRRGHEVRTNNAADVGTMTDQNSLTRMGVYIKDKPHQRSCSGRRLLTRSLNGNRKSPRRGRAVTNAASAGAEGP